jgi:CRISPR-associated protein (TIGR02710 family)
MKILVVTVGGTLEPIIEAWQSFHPDVTYFICSCDNRLTNRKGSYTQIIGTPDSPSASLLAKLDLSEDQWSHILVEPDDLIGIYKESTQLFQRLHAKWPEAQILADYTGGTKSMSAALVLASSQFAFVHLNVTTGNRQDLLKVSDGTQSLQPVNIGVVRAEWDFQAGIHHWRWYGYTAASLTLRPLLNSLESGNFRETVQMANALSQAFAHWDRFQYPEARKVLSV